MIVHSVHIPYKYGDAIKIKVISDVHYGHRFCDLKAFKTFLEDDPDAYILGNGDLIDSIIVSDVRRYRKSMDDSPGDEIIDSQIQGIVAILDPYKDRILGLGTGNHEDSITKHCGTNPGKRICTNLNVPFLGYSWLLRIVLTEEGSRGRTVIIRGHHGWGGGSRTEGGSLTKYAREAKGWDADIFLYGHDHRLLDDRIPRLGLVGEKLVAKPKVVVLCGTFQKTFSDTHDPTWAETKGFPPTEIGCPTLILKSTRDWVKIKVT